MALFDRGSKGKTNQTTESTRENLSSTRGSQQTGTAGATKLDTRTLGAAEYGTLAATLRGLNGDIGAARNLARTVGDRTRETFADRSAVLQQQFDTEGMSQINQQKQQFGSADNTASMEIENRGRQQLAVSMAGLAAEVEQQATQNELNAYKLITDLTGAQGSLGATLKGSMQSGTIRQEQQQTTNQQTATSSIEDTLGKLTGTQAGTQSPSLVDNISQLIGAFF